MRFFPKYINDWDELQLFIAEGEHEEQDFKQTISSEQKIARTLAAFANGKGGRLLVGINDSGHITGVDAEEEMYTLHEAAEYFCDPPVDLEFYIHAENKVEVLEARVIRPLKKPYAATDEKGHWRVYARVGDKTVAM